MELTYASNKISTLEISKKGAKFYLTYFDITYLINESVFSFDD